MSITDPALQRESDRLLRHLAEAGASAERQDGVLRATLLKRGVTLATRIFRLEAATHLVSSGAARWQGAKLHLTPEGQARLRRLAAGAEAEFRCAASRGRNRKARRGERFGQSEGKPALLAASPTRQGWRGADRRCGLAGRGKAPCRFRALRPLATRHDRLVAPCRCVFRQQGPHRLRGDAGGAPAPSSCARCGRARFLPVR